jgi:hypothetical protein
MEKELKLRGHIIDSLILSKLLDEITLQGVVCYAKEVKVGRRREDVSEAVFVIETDDAKKLEAAVKTAKKHGATEN